MRRRRFQRGGLSQRKRNGRLFWYFQWRENGQPRSKELGPCATMTRAGAEVMAAAIMEPINRSILKPAKPIYTFGVFVESVYLPVSRRKWKASTTMTTEALIGPHLKELGPCLLDALTRQDLQDLLDRKAASGLSRSVVNHLRWQLHAIFKLALGDGAVSNDPTIGLSVANSAATPAEKRVMSAEDVYRALKVLPIREKLIFRLATVEGMRPGEILGLQIKDDLGAEGLQVLRRVYRGNIDTPKTRRSRRDAGVSPPTRALLEQWIPLLKDQRPEAWLFQSENVNAPLSRDNVQRRFMRPKLDAIGLGWVTFQVMRRTNASIGEKNRVDSKVAADQRGHGLGVALEIYAQSDLEQKRAAVMALDRAIELAGSKLAQLEVV
jgi:integrase